ncbi:MAG: TauD/TfdA family dioxygenase [Alphaproteobacteria bacterium]|nr:TauD/TfdA family dioxygenase [Alphaproteobacteria bacterium]
MSLTVTPTGAALGADISGIDLNQPISNQDFAQILDAWAKHLVLRLRGQKLDDDALAAFSKRFGELDDAPVRPSNIPYHPKRKDIAVISNIIEGDQPIGGLGNSELVWHQDMSYKDLPPKASLLYGIETPETGGDTAFYNLYKALETLPADLRKRIEGKSCKHDATRNSAGQLRAGVKESYSNEERPGAVHPLIVRHPLSGRECLYLGRRPNAWIVGLSDAESDELLDQLWAHVENGDHTWTQQWQPGDLVIWDNRCTLHRRGPLDPAKRRRMHRTQVKDEARPVAA